MAGKYIKKKTRKLPVLLPVLLVLALVGGMGKLRDFLGLAQVARLSAAALPEWVDEQVIGVDGVSRSGMRLEAVRNIVIHYVANPGTTAQQNHDYYENPESKVSSHFLVGLKGEVILCVPLDEKSAASNHRNSDTISIEVCHPDETGKFSEETYDALVRLCAWLLENTGLEETDLIRHYDITGKNCPKYFVEDPDSWARFRQAVAREKGNTQ